MNAADRDREAFEAAWADRKPFVSGDKAPAEKWWLAGIAHAPAQAGEPVAWRYRYKPDALKATSRKWTVQKNKPEWLKPDQTDVELEPLYTHPAPMQEPVAVPAGMTADEAWQDLCEKDDRTSIDYPGFALIRQKELAAYMLAAAPVSPPAESGEEDMEHCIACDEPFKDGDLIYPDINGGYIHDDCADANGFVGDRPEPQVWPLASTPAPQRCPACGGKGHEQEWMGDDKGAAITSCMRCGGSGEAQQPDHVADAGRMIDPQPGGAVKVKALEWVEAPPELQTTRFVAKSEVGTYYVREDAWRPEDCVWLAADGIEAGKVAVQIDYDRARRSHAALSPSPSGWDAGADKAPAETPKEKPVARKRKRAAEMTDEEILVEMRELDAEIEALKRAMSDPEFGMGGSPGEWFYERYDELETQAKKRALPTPPAGEG
ncbi:DnaJ-like cysteine-rich domain-containing protein [Xanthobacter flavus]|uniref:hypothetical protein n=1 Tax=Xanthobacter flavus TaxID=281 RepID=UPI0037286003